MINKKTLVNVGILVLRIGFGIIFIIHGLPKLLGGVEAWTQLGSTMSMVGITFTPAFWGFMAAASEAIGGLFILLGLLQRPVAILLVMTMLIALTMHISGGDPFGVYSNALKALVVFIALAITGPGKYSLDYLFLRRIS
ncbi:MAG: DoxX family protein [Candidatus Saccharimonadaceae bacterium]